MLTSQPGPHRTRVKVCGVRRAADAVHAAAAGADAIGIVRYAKADRHVPAGTAGEIARSLPPFVTPVVLLVDPTWEEVADARAAIGTGVIQLHGHESPDFVREVGGLVIKAVRVDRRTFEKELAAWRAAIAGGGLDHLTAIVLETAGPGVGGTGRENDWAHVADVARRGGFEGLPPVVAAGGLTPDNVAGVIRAVRPWAVDVSSGVERVRGEKSPDLVEVFVRAVRRADAEINAGT